MASGEYMRVMPQAQPLKVYGFKKVSGRQLDDIINRLQRPTHCTETQLNSSDLWNLGNIAPRAPYSACRKAPRGADNGKTAGLQQPLKGKLLEKVIRRLQRPTISTMAAEGTIAPSYELEFNNRENNTRPSTADEQDKLLERIQRPTTASRRKLYGHSSCLLCENLQTSSVHETMRYIQLHEGATHSRRSFNSNSNTQDQSKVPRARSATHASCGGRVPCSKQASGNNTMRSRSTSQDKSLPLISGLARSEKLSEITDRLHPPVSQTPVKRTSWAPPATQVVLLA